MSEPGTLLRIEPAREDEAAVLLGLIKALAEYEKLSHKVVATEGALREWLFGPRAVAEALLARVGGAPVGFAAFFPGTRFNPITGASCVSSFDTIVIRARLPGSVVGAIDTAEYLGVKAVGTPRPPDTVAKIDQGTPPTGGGEPLTPLPPTRSPTPPGGGGNQSVVSLLFRPTAPVCRER